VKKRDKRVREKQLELQRIQKEKAEMRKQRQLQLEKEKQEQVEWCECQLVRFIPEFIPHITQKSPLGLCQQSLLRL
jgi:hypothetical protein